MPSRVMFPADGRSIRPIMFSSVDFPEPEGPEIAANSPLFMENDTFFIAGTESFPI